MLSKNFERLKNEFAHPAANLAKIKLITASDRLSRITLKEGCFWVQHDRGPVLYSGLHRRIKQIYYPDTEEGYTIGTKRKLRRKSGPRRKKVKRACYGWGMDHGRTVHDGVESFVKEVLIGKKSAVQWGKMAKLCHLDDPCVFRLLNTLIQHDLYPLYPELPVFDEKSNVATKIDLLAVDSRGNLCTVEWKTGYAAEEYRALTEDPVLGQGGTCMGDVKNCPMNRHFLQAMLGTMILRKGFPQLSIRRVLVIRIVPSTQRVYLYDMEKESKWCTDPRRLCQFYREVSARAKR